MNHPLFVVKFQLFVIKVQCLSGCPVDFHYECMTACHKYAQQDKLRVTIAHRWTDLSTKFIHKVKCNSQKRIQMFLVDMGFKYYYKVILLSSLQLYNYMNNTVSKYAHIILVVQYFNSKLVYVLVYKDTFM